jgi:hypothetical protein
MLDCKCHAGATWFILNVATLTSEFTIQRQFIEQEYYYVYHSRLTNISIVYGLLLIASLAVHFI